MYAGVVGGHVGSEFGNRRKVGRGALVSDGSRLEQIYGEKSWTPILEGKEREREERI